MAGHTHSTYYTYVEYVPHTPLCTTPASPLKPGEFRPGIVGMRGSMVIRLRPCMLTSTLPFGDTWWPQKVKKEGEKVSKKLSCKTTEKHEK